MSQTVPEKTIYLDTINVRGKITSGDGSKMAGITILTASPDLLYDGIKNNTTTDSAGNFVLKGIKPTDTLRFFAMGNDYTFINNGSRYINILISPAAQKINADNPVMVGGYGQPKSKMQYKLRTDSVSRIGIYQKASFPGGLDKFISYVRKNLKYPVVALENGIEGLVTIEFTVGKQGEPKDPRIINGLGKYCNNAVIDVIKNSPRWIPCVVRGKKAETKLQLDVAFKITGQLRHKI